VVVRRLPTWGWWLAKVGVGAGNREVAGRLNVEDHGAGLDLADIDDDVAADSNPLSGPSCQCQCH